MPSAEDLVTPQYVVLFESNWLSSSEYKQAVAFDTILANADHVCLPYTLDRDLLPVLPALWYILHLPRSKFDFLALSPASSRTVQHLDFAQRIVTAPVQEVESVRKVLDSAAPKIAFAPGAQVGAARELLSPVPHVLAVEAISDLSDRTLARHWQAIAHAYRVEVPRDWTPILVRDESDLAVAAPLVFLARLLGTDPPMRSVADFLRLADNPLRLSLEVQAHLHLLKETSGSEESTWNEELRAKAQRSWHLFKCPVAVSVPGVSPDYTEPIRASGVQGSETQLSCADPQRSVVRFLPAHRAVARHGVCFTTGVLPGRVFVLLKKLESTWLAASGPNPRKVNKVLHEIDIAVTASLSDPEAFALTSASHLTLFSEFPVGLSTLSRVSSASAPLCCRVPIAYRPLIPLTRALQFEASTPPIQYLGERVRVLVAECLRGDEIVGRLSRGAWGVAKRNLGDTRVGLEVVECLTVRELRSAVESKQWDVLVISAHGVFNRAANTAGFLCGTEVVLEPELGVLPPIVFLSACEVWPRGSGAVGVASLLFRHGAIAVVGTLIPIDVRHNSLLMVRFLANVAATLSGETQLRTFEDVWHHTLVSNAVNEILRSNRHIERWAFEDGIERSALHEFMTRRSAGRLRASHIYEDTEQILLEMAKERGVEHKFRAWLANPGYLRESLFYAVLGWPERIVLRDDVIKAHTANGQRRGLSSVQDS